MTKVNYSCSMPIYEADLPPTAGCYILFANSEGMQHLGLPQENGLSILYVGKAENSIRGRVSKTHLVSDRSGSSTLRRSLGAMLLKQLNLTPQPRSGNTEDKKRFTNYNFDSDGEVKLTNWSTLKNPFIPWLEAIESRTNLLIDSVTIVHRN